MKEQLKSYKLVEKLKIDFYFFLHGRSPIMRSLHAISSIKQCIIKVTATGRRFILLLLTTYKYISVIGECQYSGMPWRRQLSLLDSRSTYLDPSRSRV